MDRATHTLLTREQSLIPRYMMNLLECLDQLAPVQNPSYPRNTGRSPNHIAYKMEKGGPQVFWQHSKDGEVADTTCEEGRKECPNAMGGAQRGWG